MHTDCQHKSDQITVEMAQHKGEEVYFLRFKGRREWLPRIKRLGGILFSRSQRCYYLPRHKFCRDKLVAMSIPFVITGTHEEVSKEHPSNGHPRSGYDSTGILGLPTQASRLPFSEKKGGDIQELPAIEVTWSYKGFAIWIPYSIENVRKVKILDGAWWHAKSRRWLCKNTLKNLEKIQSHWQVWNDKTYQKWFDQVSQSINPCKVTFYYSPKYAKKVCVEIIGYGANHQLVKQVSGRNYVKSEKIYLIPANKDSVDQLIRGYKEIGYSVINRLSGYQTEVKVKKRTSKMVENYLRRFPAELYSFLKRYSEGMYRLGYGYSTIKHYTGKIARILIFTQSNSMEGVSARQVNQYLDYLTNKDISFSLINQFYSAVKLYHDKIAFTDHFEINQLQRPRKMHRLPAFLSEKEVSRLIDSIENIKHLAIVYLLYGAGLRKGELLGLRLEHLYWERGQILVKEGKGRKDRIVPLSEEMKKLLEAYFRKHRPVHYVFESRTAGKPYSDTSVRNIIKTAAKKAGISKRVTPHMLRHSFATHLMDRGVVLPKIQYLLGHKDVKTTMIYTHLTTKSLDEVESPLDTLLRNNRNRGIEK